MPSLLLLLLQETEPLLGQQHLMTTIALASPHFGSAQLLSKFRALCRAQHRRQTLAITKVFPRGLSMRCRTDVAVGCGGGDGGGEGRRAGNGVDCSAQVCSGGGGSVDSGGGGGGSTAAAATTPAWLEVGVHGAAGPTRRTRAATLSHHLAPSRFLLLLCMVQCY